MLIVLLCECVSYLIKVREKYMYLLPMVLVFCFLFWVFLCTITESQNSQANQEILFLFIARRIDPLHPEPQNLCCELAEQWTSLAQLNSKRRDFLILFLMISS